MKTRERKVLKVGISVLVAVIILGFSFFKAKNLLEGPQILITKPENGEKVDNSLLQIEGSAKNISEIKLNGRQIFVDKEGFFEEKVILALGFNRLFIEAKDRFGRNIKKELELVLVN